KLSVSPVSGTVRLDWTGKPYTLTVPFRKMDKPAAFATRPKAYWISPAWQEVIERLAMHGIEMERIAAPRDVDVVMVRLENPKTAAAAFEGRVGVTATPVAEKRREHFPAGSVRIATDQPRGTLAVLLLDPSSPDSFFQWGFFHAILARTEYVEGYVMEPMAERMLASDPKLAEEFRKKLLDDPAFRGNAQERLQWFYRRTPFFDERWRLYPVAREE
ncbi:MAG TPA: carboxypeptidase, partial [Thermoanaerobaculia bacterium]